MTKFKYAALSLLSLGSFNVSSVDASDNNAYELLPTYVNTHRTEATLDLFDTDKRVKKNTIKKERQREPYDVKEERTKKEMGMLSEEIVSILKIFKKHSQPGIREWLKKRKEEGVFSSEMYRFFDKLNNEVERGRNLLMWHKVNNKDKKSLIRKGNLAEEKIKSMNRRLDESRENGDTSMNRFIELSLEDSLPEKIRTVENIKAIRRAIRFKKTSQTEKKVMPEEKKYKQYRGQRIADY